MRYFRALILSLALHVLLAIALQRMNPPLTPPLQNVTMVELLEEPEARKRPAQPPRDQKKFVRSAPAPDLLRTKAKKQKRFSSAEDQTVIEEQRARASGLTANRTGNATPSNTNQQNLSAPKFHEESKRAERMDLSPASPLERMQSELSTDDFAPEDVTLAPPREPEPESRPLELPGFAGLERGLSTVGEDLPEDIKLGDFTALNTDRHLYYTFFARIEEQIRPRWVSYVKSVLRTMQATDQRLGQRESWTTKLEILLDGDGRFVKALLYSTSGVRGFDAAPVQAFRDASQFPNPPAEMIEDDGLIRLQYNFSVYESPRYAAGTD